MCILRFVRVRVFMLVLVTMITDCLFNLCFAVLVWMCGLLPYNATVVLVV
jgi:hypothetical protein